MSQILRLLLPLLFVVSASYAGEAQSPQEPDDAILQKALEAAERMPATEDKLAILKGLMVAMKLQQDQTAKKLAEGLTAMADILGSRPFEMWMSNKNAPLAAAEINRAGIEKLLNGSNLPDKQAVELLSGVKIPLSNVVLLSPSGLRYAGERGLELVRFEELSLPLHELTGWTPFIAARYIRLKAEEGARGNAAVAQANLDDKAGQNSGRTSGAFYSEIPADVKSVIRAEALKKWPGDYEMQNYAVRRLTEGWKNVQAYKRNGAEGVPSEVMSNIIDRAEQRWVSDFDMVAYDINKQVTAYTSQR